MKIACLDRYCFKFLLAQISPIAILSSVLVGCTSEYSPQAATNKSGFSTQVAQYVSENSQYGLSEAEIHWANLEKLGQETIDQYGDRFCESLRRGQSLKDITDKLKAEQAQQQYSDDEYATRLFILNTAERSLCPESSFPPVGWQRSVFYGWETVNGGTPF